MFQGKWETHILEKKIENSANFVRQCICLSFFEGSFSRITITMSITVMNQFVAYGQEAGTQSGTIILILPKFTTIS